MAWTSFEISLIRKSFWLWLGNRDYSRNCRLSKILKICQITSWHTYLGDTVISKISSNIILKCKQTIKAIWKLKICDVIHYTLLIFIYDRVKVESGIKMSKLSQVLETISLSLHVRGRVPDLSVCDAIAVGTAGSTKDFLSR